MNVLDVWWGSVTVARRYEEALRVDGPRLVVEGVLVDELLDARSEFPELRCVHVVVELRSSEVGHDVPRRGARRKPE